jgi:hypothetical protein
MNTTDLVQQTDAKVMKKPEGVKQHPRADTYYDYFHKGESNPNHLNGANPDEEMIF